MKKTIYSSLLLFLILCFCNYSNAKTVIHKSSLSYQQKIPAELCGLNFYVWAFDPACGSYNLTSYSIAYWCDSGVINWNATMITTASCGGYNGNLMYT